MAGNRYAALDSTEVGLAGSDTPTMARLPNGGFLTVWAYSGSLKAQIYDAYGAPVSAPFTVTAANDTLPGYPSIGVLSSGAFVISWETTTVDGSGFGVAARIFDAQGHSLTGIFTANTTTFAGQQQPSVAGLTDGGFVIAWTDQNGDDSGAGIHAQRFNASGGKVGGEFSVNTITGGDQLSPHVTGLPNGGYLISWNNNWYGSPNAPTPPSYSGQFYDANGQKVGGEVVLAPHDTSDGVFDVELLGSGKILVVTPYQGEIFGQMFNQDGTKSGASFQINTPSTIVDMMPQIGAVPGGGFMVTWRAVTSDGPNYFQQGDIHAQLFDASGAKLGEEFVAGVPSTSGQSWPQVTSFGSNDLAMVYQDWSGGGTTPDLKLRLFYTTDFGTEGPDMLNGDGDRNFLYGLGGNDIITGGAGGDTIDGGDGDDILSADVFGDPFAGASANYAFPDVRSDVDTLVGGAGNDTISAGYGDNVDGGTGSDALVLNLTGASAGVSVDFSAFAAGSAVTIGGGAIQNVERISSLTGSNYGDVLDAHAAADGFYFIYGQGGDDVIKAGAGTVNVSGGDGNDTIDASAVTYPFLATFSGDAGNDLLIGGYGLESLKGGTGNDTYRVFDSRVAVVENFGEGIDEVQTTLAAYTLPSNVENLTGLSGQGQALTGNAGVNVIHGGDGNDLIDGLAGADTMIGGKGDDVYVVDNMSDFVSENAGEGTDEVRTSLLDYTLSANIENLTFTGTGDAYLGGNGLANVITGGGGSDELDGLDGDDVLHTGAGDDFALGGTGNDSLYGDAGDDFLLGEAGNDQLHGGDGNDYLRGGAGVDSYDGGADAAPDLSTLVGDQVSFYERTATQGVVADLRTGIVSNDGFGNVETMTGIESLGAGTAYADIFYGNDAANGLSAETGDTLYGFGGDDIIVLRGAGFVDGGTGSDTLMLNSVGQFYLPGAGGPGTATLAPAMTSGWTVDLGAGTLHDGYGNNGTVTGIENVTGSDLGDTIVGNGGANVLNGGGGNDVLNGGAGADTTAGGTGNDIYFVDDAGDVVTENAGEGNDEVRTTLATYTLGANVEALTGLANTPQSLRGNSLDNVITAGTGDAYIDLSDGGNDRAYGGAGNDSFTFGASYDSNDIVSGGGGYDYLVLNGNYAHATLGSNVSNIAFLALEGQAYFNVPPGTVPLKNYTIVANGLVSSLGFLIVQADHLAAGETLNFDGSAETTIYFSFFGGHGNDILRGGALGDWIDGATGADTMIGGKGDDNYTVDDVGDVVVELAGEGHDKVSTFLAAYTLGDNVEDLLGNSGDQALNGNALDNTINGFGGDDVIDGRGGNDALYGGDGNDRFLVSLPGVVRVYGDAGTDTLAVDYSAATGAVTTTMALVDSANGQAGGYGDGAGRDVGFIDIDRIEITTGAGNDVIATGRGDDIATLNAGDDIVHLGGGNDTAFGGTGNDSLFGEDGNDILDGGAGADTMAGGTGDDVYYVDSLSDVVTENAGEGYDEVRTTIANYVLPANVEKLTYVGTGNFSYTGGGGNDDVTGNGGNDFFDLSQGGADKAAGGAGNDAFSFGGSFGVGDVVDGGAGTDTVGILGNYTGANKLTIGAGQLVGVETLSIQTGNAGSGPAGYDITWQDGNLASGQQITVYAGNLRAGENLAFDGSAETHGHFVFYGGLGTDDLKGGSGSDGFYFGPGKFTQADHVDGGAGSQNQLGLDGSYDFEAGSALGTFGGNFANIQTIVLYAGKPGDPSAPYPNTYHIVTNEAAVAAGTMLTIYGVPVVSDLVFDGSAEQGGGAFRILSGTGNDTLTGGAGNDILYGNLGADTLSGGAGNDTFLYTAAAQSAGTSVDHITDFDAGDHIDLSQIDADTTQGGDQAFTFIGANAFDHQAGELRAAFDAVNNVWTIEGDTDGDGNADFSLLVTTANNHVIVQGDFIA